MRNLLLSVVLVLVPVGVFSVGYKALATGQAPLQAAAAELPSLGNMAPFETIIGDVQTLHAKGDLAAAQTRITDFETAWDQAQNSLRPINKGYWGNIDDVADAAHRSLAGAGLHAGDRAREQRGASIPPA